MSTTTANSCILRGEGCGSATSFPQFIDTGACLCGLLPSREFSSNGGQEQDWRCIGNASDNVASGDTGKWYNTSLPSADLSGINQPQNWDDNPPDLRQAYVLENVDGRPRYQELGPGGSVQLIGDDVKCTGRNDTELSTTYYNKGRNMGNSTSSSMMSMSPSSSMSATSGSTMPSSTANVTSSAESPSSTSASASASPISGSSSYGPRNGLKAVMLVGMLLAPMVAMMV